MVLRYASKLCGTLVWRFSTEGEMDFSICEGSFILEVCVFLDLDVC